MTIWTPSKKKTKAKSSILAPAEGWPPRVPGTVIPKRGEYRLPVEIVDPGGLTEDDAEFLDVMMEYEPETQLSTGDMAYLMECPPHVRSKLKLQDRKVPLMWKVRFIVSAWAFELHNMAHSIPDRLYGVDHAYSVVESESCLDPKRYNNAVIYAHAMPHGLWPDTAFWFPNRCLKKVVVRDPNREWELVLDEAKAPFVGYDTDSFMRPFVWSIAPDLYGDGDNIGKPLQHEEAAIHTACILGMEDLLLGDLSEGVDPYYIGAPRVLDPEHDIFGGK